MKIAVLGVNHKLADLQLREWLAKSCQRRFAPGNTICQDRPFVLLSTCNRTEIYFSTDDLADTHSYILNILRQDMDIDFDQKLYSFFGIDCFIHLCRVTAGLDSAVMGETEIQGQVKIAYEQAMEFYKIPKAMHYLFQKALKIGKAIRSQMPLKSHLPHIGQAVYESATKHIPHITSSNVLFMGASSINQKVLAFLKSKNIDNIAFCNRSFICQEVANKQSLKILPWEHRHLWYNYEWVICGTKAHDHLITKDSLPPKAVSTKLLIDLGLPRNIDPDLSASGIALYNIDQLNASLSPQHQELLHFYENAHSIITSAAQRHIDLFKQKEEQLAFFTAAC